MSRTKCTGCDGGGAVWCVSCGGIDGAYCTLCQCRRVATCTVCDGTGDVDPDDTVEPPKPGKYDVRALPRWRIARAKRSNTNA